MSVMELTLLIWTYSTVWLAIHGIAYATSDMK